MLALDVPPTSLTVTLGWLELRLEPRHNIYLALGLCGNISLLAVYADRIILVSGKIPVQD